MTDGDAVRRAVADDAESVARVHTRSWQRAYRGLLSDAYLDALDWHERFEFWARELAAPASPSSVTFVAVSPEGNIVGFASVGPARNADVAARHGWELYGIYLDPDHWRLGLGSQLVRAVIAQIPEGAECVLWVFQANDRARQFYERFDFAPDGTSDIFERGGTQLPELRYKRLPGSVSH